jgi:hypothetical protein
LLFSSVEILALDDRPGSVRGAGGGALGRLARTRVLAAKEATAAATAVRVTRRPCGRPQGRAIRRDGPRLVRTARRVHIQKLTTSRSRSNIRLLLIRERERLELSHQLSLLEVVVVVVVVDRLERAVRSVVDTR